LIVLDSSATVDYLLRRPHGEWVESLITVDPDVHAPHLMDVEVANALRSLMARGELDDERGREALIDLARLDIARHPHVLLLQTIWRLRRNLSAYDAAYVALADALGATLVTADQRLARAPLEGVRIVAP
jgi:predicted nucleic acid-binding protein